MRCPYVVLFLFCLLPLSPAQAAPKAELWDIWQAHNPDSVLSVDHSAWDELLERYIRSGSGSRAGINLFDYAAVSAADKQRLADYLARLAAVPVADLTRDEQRAYWINLYNALTVHIIVQHDPVASIRDIADGLFSPGPWSKKRFQVGGEPISLNDIEHRILRPIWRDARLHYAVNCASLGCPNLVRQAFTASSSEMLLDAGARAYVNHPRGARLADSELVVSSIYVWFKEDFGGNDAGVIAHLRRYADEPLAAELAQIDRLGGDDYDWQLNAPAVR